MEINSHLYESKINNNKYKIYKKEKSLKLTGD